MRCWFALKTFRRIFDCDYLVGSIAAWESRNCKPEYAPCRPLECDGCYCLEEITLADGA
jgi:hypothetical protein